MFTWSDFTVPFCSRPCDPGRYSSAVGASSCAGQCPYGHSTSPGAETESECVCAPGFEGSAPPCVACPRNWYKASLGTGTCQQCPAHSGTEAEATAALEGCQCDPGYYGIGAGGNCTGEHFLFALLDLVDVDLFV